MIKFAIKLTVSGLLLWLVLRGVDGDALLAQIAKADLLGFSLIALGIWSLSAITAWRWRHIAIAVRARDDELVGYRSFWSMIVIGMFFNQTLPSAAGGDAVRMWMARRAKLSVLEAITSVVIDRAAGLAGALFLVAIFLPRLAGLTESTGAITAIILLLCGSAAAFVLAMILDRLWIPTMLRRFRLIEGVRTLSVHIRRVFLSPATAARVFLSSIVIHVSVGALVYGLARTLGISIDPTTSISLMPLVILISMIPISIAGWGVREAAMVTIFGFVGVPSTEALSLSVLFGLAVLLGGLPGGVVWLVWRGSGRSVGRNLESVDENPSPAVANREKGSDT